jgi:hypothetical protein
MRLDRAKMSRRIPENRQRLDLFCFAARAAILDRRPCFHRRRAWSSSGRSIAVFGLSFRFSRVACRGLASARSQRLRLSGNTGDA